MPEYLCATCGTQYPESASPPPSCTLCTDVRQYVGPGGQQWATLEQLRRTHWNTLRHEEPGLTSLGMQPHFAIGQRAFFLRGPGGNVLWDCLPLLDEALAEALRALGGVQAIAVSHPHYYSAMVAWSRALGGVPIYLHAADRQWVMRPDDAIVFWEGDTRPLGDGLTLIRCGGHFEGGAVLHWAGGAEGRGVILAGDILQVTADRRFVSFMYSYPNWIPLGPGALRHIEAVLAPFAYERIHGAFWGQLIPAGAKEAVARSVERYLRAISR